MLIPPQPSVASAPEVRQAIIETGDAIENLSQNINELLSRLHQVTREEKSEAVGQPIRHYNCTFAKVINERTERIIDLNRIIVDTLSRLEI